MRLTLALSLIATGAAADGCPTADDLETGIRLTRIDPPFELLFRKEDGGLAGYAPMPDGTEIFVANIPKTDIATLIHGPAVGARYVYENPLDSLDSFQAQRSWSSPVALMEGATVLASGQMSLELTGLGEIDIGGCVYAVWRIEKALTFDDGAIARSQDAFSPDLGVMLNSIQIGPDGSPLGDITFDRITAE